MTFTNIYHGPARNVQSGQAVNNATAATSENWSGYVVYGESGLFTPNDSFVFSEWIVPAVAPPVGYTCSSATFASSQWVGFDGYGSNDVLQAGSETNCGNSDYSWYEWYPNAETEVSVPASPGDVMDVEVEYTTASPHGTAFISNLALNAGTAFSFNPPSGTTYVGNSAEWILERPTVNGALADLPNYVIDLFDSPQAYNGTHYLPGGPVPPDGAIYSVTMTCPPWTPASACASTTDISVVEPPTSDNLIFSYVF